MKLCQCCHVPMRHDIQPSYFAGRPDLHLYTCDTPGCQLQHATLPAEAHDALTPEQIDGYARARRRTEVANVVTGGM